MYRFSSALVAQGEICGEAPQWCFHILRDLESRLAGDSVFPCVFSKNAFKKKLLRFVFVETFDPQGIHHLADGLKQYVELSRQWDGTLDTAYPLVVAFSQSVIRADSVAAYHAFGWQVLQTLHDIDPAPWPDDVGQDPDAADWSMCFNGMPLFCNMSNPAHQGRRSRNLGDHFILVINPRERFDAFAGDTPSGRKVRAQIRQRVERYDGQAHAPQLGFFGTGGSEWWQYGLLDDNRERFDQCPFLVRMARAASTTSDG
ncbi:hypothetical protein SAMN05216359_11254 [Roseateles sp. YR242]|uniref:YqcI/YcgG family protein n=1 Tax=Roseateles sp. YR242 TaxID=1855305 RepID=UPI0008AEA99C|nr:YqcI/YcgG family protein [Roseateles sp. YR242]SEL61399.1 hypothetical protein SAMN05216359_11254 [Roseateles sp. YR242]